MGSTDFPRRMERRGMEKAEASRGWGGAPCIPSGLLVRGLTGYQACNNPSHTLE